MKPLFTSKELKKEVKLTRDLNSQNGNDSEIISGANLIQALNAELSWGSRNEDNSKIDLLLSFNHPWIIGQRVLLLSQVKSGHSFGNVTEKKIKLYARSIKAAKASQNNICLVWYDHTSKENYWAYIHRNSKSNGMDLGKNHILSPATRFELARCINSNIILNKFNSRGLILDLKTLETMSISDFRKDVKKRYRKNKIILNPLYGSIEINNFGWKHMFRKTRLKKFKNDSLVILPYLKQLLTFQPDRHWIISFEKHKHKEHEILNYNHVLRYENIRNNKNSEVYEIVIKLVEEVVYPLEWKKENLLSQKVFRKVVFKSCSLKLKKA